MNSVPTNMPVFKEYEPTEENFSIGHDSKGLSFTVIREHNGSVVATLPNGLRPEEKTLARLFANSPQMLEALEYVLGEIDLPKDGRFYIQNIVDEIRGE